ncbi:MAG: DM13 domain-containing protein [bacterium]|nr:DM13 domain-containing protein [Acidimicrobiia bacterium]MCY4651264.1 DM13 domain-containing protein [bacterium]
MLKRFLHFLLALSVRTKITIAVIVVGLGVFVTAYFEPHKLFIDEVVDEEFPAPVAIATTTTAAEATPATTVATTTVPPTTIAPDDPVTTTTAPTTTAPTTEPTGEDPEPGFKPATEEEQESAPVTTTSTTTTTTTVPPPTTTTTVPEGPVLLSSSEWIDLGHPGTGTVLVYRQPDGSHVIRFEDLDVSNGPDLLVILSASPLVDDRGAYSATEYLSLGDLKGNQGNQNYEVPADVNLDDYLTVAIWCRRFNYTFNAADIHSPPA